ncbi:protein HIDE1 isoform X2 [Pelobates fuscus]|uniref:protein HIDE1 isoform X2 n=1 Tax=Pelobates fuscus TaxID=191477 RepID=UPI002FE46E44
MELSQLLLLLGVIAMKIARTKQGLLPAPNLTLLTEGAIFKGRSVSLQCAAPSDRQGSTFHLQIRDDGKLVETKEAPQSMHSVTFTIAEFTVPGNYVCRYQQLVSTTCGISKTSNILHLTLSAVPDFTTQPPGPTKAGVPFGIIVLVGAITGLVVVVISVTITVYIKRIYDKRKKRKQRERESVWTPRDMASDWTYDNTLYSLERRPPSEPQYSHQPNRQILGESWTEKSFSSFHQ